MNLIFYCPEFEAIEIRIIFEIRIMQRFRKPITEIMQSEILKVPTKPISSRNLKLNATNTIIQ